MNKERMDLLSFKALELWGEQEQIFKLYEELSELGVAVNQWRLGRLHKNAVLEEIADVKIMIHQLLIILDSQGIIDNFIENKLNKLENIQISLK